MSLLILLSVSLVVIVDDSVCLVVMMGVLVNVYVVSELWFECKQVVQCVLGVWDDGIIFVIYVGQCLYSCIEIIQWDNVDVFVVMERVLFVDVCGDYYCVGFSNILQVNCQNGVDFSFIICFFVIWVVIFSYWCIIDVFLNE